MDKIALFQLVHGALDRPTLIEEHRSILAAIESADEDQAVASMKAYLHTTDDLLISTAKQGEFADERAAVSAVG